MSDFEEQTISALKSLFEKVETLAQINIRDIIKPETYRLYEVSIQEAYDALTKVEDVFDNERGALPKIWGRLPVC